MTIKRLYLRKIDILLFILLVGLSLIITYLYISQEKYFYYWDYSRSSSQINDLILSFKKSPFEGIGQIIISLFDDYTQLPSFPILPFRIVLGESRLSFIYCLVLAYIIPFCMMMGAILIKVIQFNPRTIFWTASFFSFLIPPVWVSVYRGFPDIGGSTLIFIAISIYWKNLKLKDLSQRYAIAAILAIAVLFRRHFIYSVRAFIISIVLYSLIFIISRNRTKIIRSLKYFKIFYLRVFYISILFAVFTFIVIIKALLINYRILYLSYEVSVESNIQYYMNSFGLILFVFSVIGFLSSFFDSSINQKNLLFILVFYLVSIFQWIFFAKQVNVQYSTHFVPFCIIGNYLFLWSIYRRILKPWSIVAILLSLSILIFNVVLSFFSIVKMPPSILYLFSKLEPPLFRSDYSSVASLVKYLRSISNSEKKIYVAASSHTLNYSIFTIAEQQLFGKSILPISRNSNIDSRDFYPLNGLLQAHYVVVASPYQYHVDPKEQTVVKVVVDAFNQNWAIAKDFTPLPQTFVLENGVTVRIYERIHPTSFPIILETLAKMRSQVSRTPGQEPFWLDLKSDQPSAIIQDPLLRRVQVLRLPITNQTPASLLYYGQIPAHLKVSGLYSISKCPNTMEPIAFKLSTLGKNGNVLLQTIKSYPTSQLAPFELKISGQNTAFLRFDLMVGGKSDTFVSCRAELNLLKVSPQ